jgi:DNA-binding response OmpR family regulator
VRDHGPGIPIDFKPLVFEKFAQADARDARQKGGTGLGLSIAKQIVDRLSGEVGRLREMPQYRDTSIIVVSADPGRGRDDLRSSKLNVLDWLNKPIDFDRLMRTLAKSVVHDPSRRPRILHVDDDNDVARALSKIADVVTVNSIEAAQRALKAGDFDLAVLDVALAKTASPDLLPELRDSKGNVIPVVVFSAKGADLASDAQEQAMLAKSHSSIDSLVAAVRDRLASRSAGVSREIA